MSRPVFPVTMETCFSLFKNPHSMTISSNMAVCNLWVDQSTHNLQAANRYNCTQLTPQTASVVPPEDGRLTPETCRGLGHNKAIVKVKVY
jgi:hypothetical protein